MLKQMEHSRVLAFTAVSASARLRVCSSGSPAGYSRTFTLGPYDSVGVWQGNDTSLPNGWTGSVIFQANGPYMAVVLREDKSNSISASNGILR